MNTMSRLYSRVDEWLRGLSRVPYAGVLGLVTGLGVLLVGLLVGGDTLLVEAVTMAVVMFGLECVFGVHQADE